jgi:hypothetical protein
MRSDVKAVQDVQGLPHRGRDHAQIGFPHVTADKPHPLDAPTGGNATRPGFGGCFEGGVVSFESRGGHFERCAGSWVSDGGVWLDPAWLC